MHEKALQLLTDEVIHFVASSDRNWTLDDPAEISKDFVWNVLLDTHLVLRHDLIQQSELSRNLS